MGHTVKNGSHWKITQTVKKMSYCKTLVALGKIGRTVQKRVRFGKKGHTVKNESYLEKPFTL